MLDIYIIIYQRTKWYDKNDNPDNPIVFLNETEMAHYTLVAVKLHQAKWRVLLSAMRTKKTPLMIKIMNQTLRKPRADNNQYDSYLTKLGRSNLIHCKPHHVCCVSLFEQMRCTLWFIHLCWSQILVIFGVINKDNIHKLCVPFGFCKNIH